MPKISICIPTFNRCELLEKTLQSVISQTEKPFEVIVIDNHSTDNTSEIVKRYKKFGLKYYRNRKNIGFVGNWNKCLELSSGDYLCMLHADDLIAPNWYQQWNKVIKKNQDVDAFFSAWCFINLESQVTSVYIPFQKSQKFKKGHVIKEFYSKNFFSPAVSGDLIIRKSLFAKTKLGKFQEYLQTETDLAMYFPLMTHYSLYYLNHVLFGYRIHPFQTIDKKVEKTNAEKLIASASRYITFIHEFYYNDLMPTIGKYDIFYKKLLVIYQFRAIYRSLVLKKNVFKKTNSLIQQAFPNFLSLTDYFLYVSLGYEFVKRFLYGKLLALQYRKLFLQ